MHETIPFIALNTTNIPWAQNVTLFELNGAPRKTHPNLKCKLLMQDKERGQVAAIVQFPPGHIEEPHAHSVSHSVIVLEGEQHVDGKILRTGDFHYAPGDVQHGPFSYPVGCTIFAVWYVPPNA